MKEIIDTLSAIAAANNPFAVISSLPNNGEIVVVGSSGETCRVALDGYGLASVRFTITINASWADLFFTTAPTGVLVSEESQLHEQENARALCQMAAVVCALGKAPKDGAKVSSLCTDGEVPQLTWSVTDSTDATLCEGDGWESFAALYADAEDVDLMRIRG